MDKRGDWDSPRSWWYFLGGLVFLYLALMPFFNVFPFSFAVGDSLLRIFIALIGILILFESFTMDPINKLFKIIIGLVFAVFGVWLFFSFQGASWLPFDINLSDTILQIVLIVYAAYLFIGAWRQ